MDKNNQDRAKILLKATLDILTKCEESPVVLDVSSQTAFWDGTDCDGNCLREEIKEFLCDMQTSDLTPKKNVSEQQESQGLFIHPVLEFGTKVESLIKKPYLNKGEKVVVLKSYPSGDLEIVTELGVIFSFSKSDYKPL
jgi:hypothetical protein